MVRHMPRYVYMLRSGGMGGFQSEERGSGRGRGANGGRRGRGGGPAITEHVGEIRLPVFIFLHASRMRVT
jgi:hypothetical protein